MTAATSSRGRPGPVWVLPGTLFFVGFGVLPIAVVGYLSLTRWNGLGDPAWVGLANWQALSDDPDLGASLRASAALTVLCWVVQTPLALLLGVWAAGAQRNRAVLSTVYFLPMLLSTAAIALAWLSLLDPYFGPIAALGQHVGMADLNVLGHPQWALLALVAVVSWQFVPFHTLIYQAAARQIPTVLYEAATVDGASRLRQFWSITLPQLRHTIVASSVMIVVGSLTYFETVLMLTGGGPGTATQILPLHMYEKGFIGFEMGYASALAVLLVGIGTALSVLIVRLTGYHQMTSQREGL